MGKMRDKTDYPDMASEVIEAIHLMHEDDPDVEVDCWLYLENLSKSDTMNLGLRAAWELNEMDRCTNCGELLKVHHWREPHPELDGCPYEDMYESYCPLCDGGVND